MINPYLKFKGKILSTEYNDDSDIVPKIISKTSINKNLYLSDIKISFFIPIWGEDYINKSFKKTLICFLKSSDILKTLNEKSNLCIWTKKEDKIKIDNLKEIKALKKYIDINFFFIDEIFELYENYTKYELLSIFQNLFISYSTEKDYLVFIYPDFIFNSKSLNYLLNAITKNYSAIFCPVPQLNVEDIESKLTEKGIDNFLENIEENVFNNMHNIVLRTIINENKISSTSSVIVHKDKDFMLLNSFHIHPLAIKVQRSNYKFYKPFFPSFDEAFVSIYDDEDDYYICKDSNDIIFASLASKYELQSHSYNMEGDINSLSEWASRLTNYSHRKFVKESYILRKNNFSKIDLNNSSNLMKEFIDKLLLLISRKKTYNEYNYINNDLLDYNFDILKIRIKNYDNSILEKEIEKGINNLNCSNKIKKIIRKIYQH